MDKFCRIWFELKINLAYKVILIITYIAFYDFAYSQVKYPNQDTSGIYPFKFTGFTPIKYSLSGIGYYKPSRSFFCELEKNINPGQKRWLAFRLGSFEQSNLLEYGPQSHHYDYSKQH